MPSCLRARGKEKMQIAEDFDAPLPDDLLAMFEGR